MSTIPLKSSNGTITLFDNGMLEIRKIDIIIIISKNSLNRVNISSEGRVILYQANTNYSADHEIRVDKVNIPKVQEMFALYFSEKQTGEAPTPAAFNEQVAVMEEYKKSIKMIGEQLILLRNFNIETNSDIEERFLAINNSIRAINERLDAKPPAQPTTFIIISLLCFFFLYNLYLSVGDAKKILADKGNTTYPTIEMPILRQTFEEYVCLESF